MLEGCLSGPVWVCVLVVVVVLLKLLKLRRLGSRSAVVSRRGALQGGIRARAAETRSNLQYVPAPTNRIVIVDILAAVGLQRSRKL